MSESEDVASTTSKSSSNSPPTKKVVEEKSKEEKDSRELKQKEWMKQFLDESKNKTIADYMGMFMAIRMRQEQMRGDDEYSSNVALHPNQYIRNRYRDILPYDSNRVSISPNPCENAQGYINASKVSLKDGLTNFIAAQAPLSSTLDDFWQMIDEQGVHLIVMLCKLVEMNKAKCERYWPEVIGSTQVFGIYEISFESEERFDDDEYVLRKLKMKKEGTKEERIIHQLHYSEWPDHGCPMGTIQLLNMIDKMSELSIDNNQVLVHCSAGVGRTGTIILINHIRELIQQNLFSDINLVGLVMNLREQRSSMVQTQDQFQFVYRCVGSYCRKYLGLPCDESNTLPPPPAYVTSMLGNHHKMNISLESKVKQTNETDNNDNSDSDCDKNGVDNGTNIPDYPDEPRAPNGPEDINSST